MDAQPLTWRMLKRPVKHQQGFVVLHRIHTVLVDRVSAAEVV